METIKEIAAFSWAAIAPLLVAMIGIYGRPLVNAAIAWLNAKTNTTLSERDMAALQSALGNAAWRLGSKVFGDRGQAITIGIDYLKTSVPETMQRLEIMSENGIVNVATAERLLAPHIEKVKAEMVSRNISGRSARRDANDPGDLARSEL